MTDPITLTLGAGLIASGSLTIWMTWRCIQEMQERLKALDERDEAQEALTIEKEQSKEAIALASKWVSRWVSTNGEFAEYQAAEPARIAAAIADHQRAHMKRISPLGNKSPKRRKREGAQPPNSVPLSFHVAER